MPTRLHVLTIRPRLNANNDIEIQMTVAGDSRDKAIELVQNMEKSRDFRHAQVTSEVNSPKDQAQGGQFGDSVRFEITAQYVPLPAPVAPPAQPPAAPPRSGE